ncbi:MAG: PD-(D/E)XK nuclease family protein, partial [Acidimicrobiales bacterium]
LEGVAELRRIEPLAADPGLGAPGLRRRQISSALTSALSRTVGTRGRFGVGPVVGTINALAGMRTELLVVVGAREGLLPGRTPEDPLVTELDRASVQVLADRERVEQRDRRTMLMLLAGAEQVVATYPRVDRGATRLAYPSRWLAGDLFDGRIEEIASFPAALAAVADGRFAPADPFDLELAVVARAMTARRPVSELFVARLGDLGRRLLAERERHAPYLSRFAGRVGPRASNDELLGEVLSPTRIEDLAKCPLQFMFGRLVKLEVLEAPDRLDTISARDRGTLIHEILERFVEQTLIGRESFLGWSTADWDLLRHIAEECFTGAESRGLTGKALYWQMERRQVLADLRRFLEIEQVRLLASGGRPLRTEVAFGFGDVAPVEISAGGDVLRFRGKVDRVDEERDGVVRVIDYKSGSAGDYGTIQSDPLGSGKHLQLPIYAKAAPSLVGFEPRTVVAEYRFCSSAAGFEAVPVTLTPELETDLSAVLSTLTRTIKDGIFPPRPGGDDFRPENCRRCEFASMCRLDRFTQWDRALSDPSVVDYVALVEPSRAAS